MTSVIATSACFPGKTSLLSFSVAGRRHEETNKIVANTARSTPSQKGRNAGPGPNVADAGILQASWITNPESAKRTTPVIISAFFICRLLLPFHGSGGAQRPRFVLSCVTAVISS